MVTFVIWVAVFFGVNALIKILALAFLERDRGYNALDLVLLLGFFIWGLLVLLSK